MMENIHWSNKIAQKIVTAHPNLPEYIVSSGITPSGSVHIGNFREFITSYLVGKALQDMGKKVRMLFFWDDFDRLRKVPAIVSDPEFYKHIGKPVSQTPDPWGEFPSFSARFTHAFEQSLSMLGLNEIPVELRYQSKAYTSGKYNNKIIHALNNRHKIYDIITSFKTQGADEGEREHYYPVSVYCKKCGKDSTHVTAFDEKTNMLTYTCKCGHPETLDVNSATNIKLVWKVDWPMRWSVEKVIFEPAGPDHLTSGGSYDVATRIAREIFNHEPPLTQIYGFVGIKGQGVKMSSSKGENITPSSLLNIYEPKIIKWLFAKYAPEAFFEFGFDDTIIRHYQEFDRETNNTAANFGTLATIGPLAGFNFKLAEKMLPNTPLGNRLEKVKYWLEHYAPEKIYRLRDTFNAEYYATLSDEEKSVLKKLHGFLTDNKPSQQEIQEFLYSIINNPNLDKKQNVASQQRYFKIFYNMLFGRDDGPRLYLYLAVAEQTKILPLIQP